MAPSDVTSKHEKHKQNSQKHAKLGTFCVFSLSFLVYTEFLPKMATPAVMACICSFVVYTVLTISINISEESILSWL